VSHFVEESTNYKSLASLAAGSLAYRYTRLGVMLLGEGRLAGSLLRPLSVGLGLGGEVFAFEGASRGLATLSGDRSNPNLWRWNGTGGWRQGVASSFVTFGLLKGAGHLTRESNLVLQHAFSSSAMVLGHQAAALTGWMPRPEGSWAEQLLHA